MPSTHSSLPVLKEHQLLRFLTLGMLYVAQGLPIGLFQVAIPAWLAAQGLSAAEVGSFIFIAFLPWSFKLVAGPVMDRFSFPPMGRRRPWVLGAQSGIVLVLVAIMLIDPNPAGQFMLMASLGFLVNAFGALQDVAVDGMAIDILEDDERGRANAFMFGGQVIGLSAASAIGSVALGAGGLSLAALILALAVAAIMVIPLFLRERPGERLLPWSPGQASREAIAAQTDNFLGIFATLIKALILPISLLLVVLEGLNRMASGLLLAINPVLTVQDLGWSQTDYSGWIAIAGVCAAVFGVVLGPTIDRFGARKILMIAVGIRAGVFLLVALTEPWWQEMSYFKAVLMINSVSGQIVSVAIIALFMKICLQQISATQFAVYMASANLTLSMGSGLAGPLNVYLDYSGMFLVVAGMNVAFMALWPFLDLERQQRDLDGLTAAIDMPTADVRPQSMESR